MKHTVIYHGKAETFHLHTLLAVKHALVALHVPCKLCNKNIQGNTLGHTAANILQGPQYASCNLVTFQHVVKAIPTLNNYTLAKLKACITVHIIRLATNSYYLTLICNYYLKHSW